MTKYEIYTSIALITIILISVLWKEELKYRRKFVRTESSIEIFLEPPSNSVKINPNDGDGYLGKRKPDPQGWLKKHEKYLHFNSLASNDL